MKKTNRFLAMLLVVCTIVMMCMPLSALAVSYIDSPSGASGSTYAPDRPKLAAKLDQVFSGDIDIFYDSSFSNEISMPLGYVMDNNHEYWITAYNEPCRGYQCWIYANAAYNKICGEWVADGGYYSHTYDVLSYGSGLNYNSFSSAGVRCGAYVRTETHSMVVLSYNSSQISCINGNADGYGKVRINTWTWSELQSWYGTYVRFAAQPTQSWWDNNYPVEEEYWLDINGYLNGEYHTSLEDFGTCDVYINGSLASSGCSDYYVKYPNGTKYEIKNIKAASGYVYNGVSSGSLSGTINGDTSIALNYSALYTVTFKDWDGTILDTQSVAYGKSATAPQAPTRPGHTFSGWDKSFSNVTSNLTITALYDTNTYTVTFKDWDGTVLKTQSVAYGASATAPANPTRTGYTFTGWDKDFSNVTSNLTITAQYKINTYTVTFKNWDGTVLKTQTVEHGASAIAPANPTRPGYAFTGWDKGFTNVTSDLVVTAQYALIQTDANVVVTSVSGKPGDTVRVPIKIEKNPGIMAIGIDIAYDASVLELVGTEKGDIFTGSVFEVPSQNLSDNPYRYTVTDATNEYSEDGTLVTYIFKIMETAQPGTETALELSVPFAYNLAEQQVYFNAKSGDVSIIPPISVYKVTFKDWDGTVLKTQEVNEGESATAPANPTRPGYVFTGWDKDFTNVHSDLVVTAKYRLANGAELTIQSKTTQAGQTVEVAVEIAKNPGIMYLRVTPDYDKSYLTLTGVKNGNVFPDNAFSYDTNVTFDVMSNNTVNGTLLIMTFKVADNAPEGSYRVGITVRECYNYDEDDVDVTSANGTITVSSILYGDVNGDGVIDGKDVIRLRKYLAAYDDETGTSTVEIGAGADCNGDGKVDGKDLVRLRKYLAAYDDDTGTSPVHLGPEN